MKFCQALYITSPKAYKLLRKVISLPSKSTLFKEFSNSISEIKSCLIQEDIEQKGLLFNNLCLTEKIPVAIAIDATVASPNPALSTSKINNVFLLQIQPLSHCFQNLPISIIPSNSGQMNEVIKSSFENILLQLTKKFDIIYKCSDGDQGTKYLQFVKI